MDKNKILFIINLFLAIFFLIYSLRRPIYIFDAVLYLVLVGILWKYGKSLNQTFISMLMIFAAIFLHNLGSFGAFAIAYYDKFLHLFSGVYLSYALFLFARPRASYRTAIFIAIIGSLGFSALAEISEFSGYKFAPLNPLFEGGLLDPGLHIVGANEKSIYTDTIEDMIMNLVGSILTMAFMAAKFLKTKPKKSTKRGVHNGI